MSKYLLHQTFVEAETMTLGEAIEAGIVNGFIDSETKGSEGFKVTFHNRCVTWIPRALFESQYLPADDNFDLVRSAALLKRLEFEKAIREIDSQALYNEESVSTNAAIQLDQYLKAMDYNHASRYCEAADKQLKGVPMDNLSFLEALALMNMGFAVRNRSWASNQCFVVKNNITYHPSYFADNEDHPVNPAIVRVLRELMENCDVDKFDTYEIVGISTGVHSEWECQLSETSGVWEVVY